MARKPKEQDIEAPAPVVYNMTEVELLKLKLADCEARLANTNATMKLIEKHNYIRSIDPDNKISEYDRQIKEWATISQENRAKAQLVAEEVGKRLGIDMAKYGWDDQTGALIPHAQ